MQTGMMTEMMKQMRVSAEAAAAFQPMQEEMNDLFERELSWDSVKGDFADIYASTFTASELKGLIAFDESSVGRALLDKTPDVTVTTMEVTQRRMANLMPKVQEIALKHAQRAAGTPTPE